jgi:hypothetical protein
MFYLNPNKLQIGTIIKDIKHGQVTQVTGYGCARDLNFLYYATYRRCGHDGVGSLYNADGIALEDLNSHTFFYADNEIESCLNLIEIGYDAEISQ